MRLPKIMQSIKIADFSFYVIMAFIFSIPISTSVSNILAVLIVLLWLIEGNFREKFHEIKNNKVTMAVLAYVLLHLVGLLWTSDLAWGLYTVKKQWKLLLLPVFLTIVRQEHKWYYINSFVAAMAFSVAVSYGIWLEFFSFEGVPPSNPSPFITHVMYNPLLALGIYLLSYQLIFNHLSVNNKLIVAAIIAGMTFNMFLVQGRTGQAVFLFLFVLFIFQVFKKKYLLATTCLMIIPLMLMSAYFSIPQFRSRVNDTVNSIKHFDLNASDSLPERATFVVVSSPIIQQNLMAGVGTGDFPQACTRMAGANGSLHTVTVNPHNQYLLVLSQFGVIGLIIFSTIFCCQFHVAINSASPYKLILYTFPLFYLFIFLGDSSLQASGTSLLFSIFSAFLYKNLNP